MAQEPMDVPEVVERLQRALRLVLRSVHQFTLVGGSLTGMTYQYAAEKMSAFAEEDLRDARRLVEKLAALGGRPTTDIAPARAPDDPADAMAWLIESESEAIDALKDVIPPSGDEGRSEALEHLVEHMIMRKQNQVDHLLRATGEPNEQETPA